MAFSPPLPPCPSAFQKKLTSLFNEPWLLRMLFQFFRARQLNEIFEQNLTHLFNEQELLKVLFQFFGIHPGDTMEGGVVAYWEEATGKALIVALEDAYPYRAVWTNHQAVVNRTSTLKPDLWRGGENTREIIGPSDLHFKASGRVPYEHDYPAAYLASKYRGGGYEDWHLPSYHELLEVNKQLREINKSIVEKGGKPIHTLNAASGNTGVSYWTSSQQGDGRAYIVIFGKEIFCHDTPMKYPCFVRSVRTVP
jgi:hypothetical protein